MGALPSLIKQNRRRKMADMKKLEITELNQPVIMELKYDSPLKGESKYGQYFAYAFDSNGEDNAR